MGPLDGKQGPSYMFFNVAVQIPTAANPQNVIDLFGEWWVPYDVELITPGDTPLIGRTFADSIRLNRVDPVIAAKLKDFILFDIHNSGGTNYLIFARDIQPSSALKLTPTSQWESDETWTWPAILRKWSVRFVVNNKNLIDLVVDQDLVERQQLLSTVVYRQWWTSVPWPTNLRLTVQMQPSTFRWNYPISLQDAKGSIECLRPKKIQVPPFPLGLNGYELISFQGIEYDKTNVGYWVPDRKYWKQDQIRGRFFSEEAVAQPPYSPVQYPKPPRIYAS